MAKDLKFNEDARQSIKKGIDKVAEAVRTTIGPKGKNVILDKGYGSPTITNDGVTIVKEIEFEDKFENMGADLMKEVASKTNEIAGDGTTTSTILTQAIVGEGLKYVAMGVNPVGIRHGIERAGQEVITELKNSAKKIKSREEIAQVATISAEDAEIGNIIAEIMEKVGNDGVITVEESQTFGLSSEIVEGMEFDKGYVSPYMVTDTEKMRTEMNEPYILITDRKISAISDILPVLEAVAQTGKKEVVIIAEEIDGEALTTLVINKLRGTFSALAVKAPGFGDRRKEMLQDIAIITGGQVVSEETGMKLENTTLDMLGRAKKVIATKDNTMIVDGAGNKKEIAARVEQIKGQISSTSSNFDKEKLQERLAKLSGGVAVLKVGAATESELTYKKHKVEDALAATKAAVEEGIVAGGGTAFIKAGVAVQKRFLDGKLDFESEGFKDEVAAGIKILLRALEEPLRQIVQNAGREEGAVIADFVKNDKAKNSGYNALTNKREEDMVAVGIIDPVKVTRTALENAISVSAMLLTTEVAITDTPKKGGDSSSMGGMGGGMGMPMGM